MNYKNIINSTVKNGGYSSDMSNRYIVAIQQNELIVSIDKFNEELVSFYHKHIWKDDLILGTWINENKVYLDSSKGFDDLQMCMEFARENKQLAIYDAVEDKTINIE